MIPDRKGERWYERKAVIEALGIVPPLVAAAVGALTSLSDRHKQTFGIWLLAGVLWMGVASIAKVLHARAQDRERKQGDEYAGFRAVVHVLFSAVCEAAELSGDDRANGTVRLTIHRVVPDTRGAPPEELEQLLPYMGGPGSPPGRRFSIRSGITGKAARWKSAVVAERENADYETFVGDLVREWAYTEHDARKLSPDRQTWMAVPLLHPRDGTMAVVYLDSRDPGFFTEPLQELVLTICRGVDTYTVEAYP
jgi:hypothetical protein